MNPSSGVVFQYKPKEGAEELIYQRISDITISMKALDYLNMPDCIPTRYEVEMNAEERKLYDMLRQDLLIPLKDGDIDAANAASLTGKLLQMSNGAVYDENGKARVLHDHKLEALECRQNPGCPDPPGLCRTWSEHPAGWTHSGLVRPDMEP